jgi:gas vesicle protein
MKQTPYYRSPDSIVTFLAGATAGVAAATLFDPPSRGVTPVKVRRKVRAIDDDAALANGRKRSYS